MRPDNVVRFRGVNVSIHASVKDATVRINFEAIKTGVSIHASVKDATHQIPTSLPGVVVSIHASVKDATAGKTIADAVVGFNPRICKRCDR